MQDEITGGVLVALLIRAMIVHGYRGMGMKPWKDKLEGFLVCISGLIAAGYYIMT